jgi:hypothetical protein
VLALLVVCARSCASLSLLFASIARTGAWRPK